MKDDQFSRSKKMRSVKFTFFSGFVKLDVDGKLVFAGKEVFDGGICHLPIQNAKVGSYVRRSPGGGNRTALRNAIFS